MRDIYINLFLIILITSLLVDVKVNQHEKIGPIQEEIGVASYSDQKICNAIWYVEGGEKANQEYGINPQYVVCENRLECYNVCVKTVAKWRKVYNSKKENVDFLTFLSYKYCPPNHAIWLKNLKFYLRKLK